MWMLYAIGSSFFAGITAILAKCGIKKTDSDVGTAIRTIVVLVFSWLMVLITGTGGQIMQINGETFLFLVLSGLATGASWLCYFHALQKGNVNKVVPIDKSSTVLTILLALIFLHEGMTAGKVISIVLIGLGTMLMITKNRGTFDGMDDGSCDRKTKISKTNRKKRTAVYTVVRACYWRFVDVLLPGITGRTRECGRAD